MRPYGCLWVFIGPYRSLSALMDSNMSLLVLSILYAFLLVLIKPYKF